MRFGEEASPRIYTWGNIGVPATNAAANVVMGVARATEGGSFSRNYVPMHDASTTDPVVRQVRMPLNELTKTQFKSFSLYNFSIYRAALAVDAVGRMWSWGFNSRLGSGNPGNAAYDATGVGGPLVQGVAVQHMRHRPIRVLMPSERETGQTATWSKVQFRPSQPASVALSSEGTLYGSGFIPEGYFLDSQTALETKTQFFTPLSTQVWNDFAIRDNQLWAIRNDGTLHTKELFNPDGSQQVKGIVVDATFDSPCFLPTGTSTLLSYSLPTPATGTRASLTLARNTTTGEFRPYIQNMGMGYTAAPPTTRIVSPSTAVTPQLKVRIANDTAWKRIDSNGWNVVLFSQVGAGTAAYNEVFTIRPPASLLADGGYISDSNAAPGSPDVAAADIFNVGNPGRITDQRFPYIDYATAAAVGYSSVAAGDANSIALRLDSVHTNDSNIIAWGGNASGCLAVGSTSPQNTLRLVPSPDTADFFARSLSIGGNYTLAVRETYNWPQPGSRLYCAGKHDFAGNSAATASITTFTMCSPESVNRNHNSESGDGRHWYSAFAHNLGSDQFSIASRDYAREGSDDDRLT